MKKEETLEKNTFKREKDELIESLKVFNQLPFEFYSM